VTDGNDLSRKQAKTPINLHTVESVRIAICLDQKSHRDLGVRNYGFGY